LISHVMCLWFKFDQWYCSYLAMTCYNSILTFDTACHVPWCVFDLTLINFIARISPWRVIIQYNVCYRVPCAMMCVWFNFDQLYCMYLAMMCYNSILTFVIAGHVPWCVFDLTLINFIAHISPWHCIAPCRVLILTLMFDMSCHVPWCVFI
jgi:hypothetical protein